MEALLAAMGGITKKESQFPCLPYVAYALMEGMDFQEYEPEESTHVVEQQKWAIPDFSTVDFYGVPQDITYYLIYIQSNPQGPSREQQRLRPASLAGKLWPWGGPIW